MLIKENIILIIIIIIITRKHSQSSNPRRIAVNPNVDL